MNKCTYFRWFIVKINEKDKKILKELQKNCRQSSRQLSKKLGIPATTIHSKIKKFEREGIIKKYTAILDPEKIGLPSVAFVLVRVQHIDINGKRMTSQDVVRNIIKLPCVCEAHGIAGPHDLILKVRGESEKQIGLDIINIIRDNKNVVDTQTNIVVFTEKEVSDLPIN